MRGTEYLHPKVAELANKLVGECENQGLKIKITDTLRTGSEQNALYAKGRTKPGSKVTNARYPQSNHNWGIAFDFCRNDGAGAFNESGNFFHKVGQVGKSIGLSWGGDWTSFKDKPHFEFTGFGQWRNLQTKYGSPDGFKKTWGGNTPAPAPPTGGDRLVAEYQRVLGKGLACDGIYGPKTEEAATTICKGSKGALVTVLQKLLSSRTDYFGGAWDGVFGGVTEATVIRYQREKGLSVDGIVGKKTWKALLTRA